MIKKYSLLALGLVFSFAPTAFAAQEEENDISLAFNRELRPGEDRFEMIQKMLQAHPELVHARNQYGTTLLHRAATTCSLEINQLLLDHGADVNARDVQGSTPLHDAVINDYRILCCFIEAGADVHAKDNNEKTALHAACIWNAGSANVAASAQRLIELGADLEAVTGEDSRTPLHYASSASSEIIIKHLLLAGAYVDREDANGRTPLHKALSTALVHSAASLGLETLLTFGVSLRIGKEIDQLKSYPMSFYEAVRLYIQMVRQFFQNHLPALEEHYLDTDYERLQLPDDVRRLLLGFIATPGLEKRFNSRSDATSTAVIEEAQRRAKNMNRVLPQLVTVLDLIHGERTP